MEKKSAGRRLKTAKEGNHSGKMIWEKTMGLDEKILENLPILRNSMTFSKMLQMDTSVASLISKWHWFFPPVCQRKDQALLTDIEKAR